MFAIELSHENLDKIVAHLDLAPFELLSFNVYVAASATYYVITGYENPKGQIQPHTVLPEYILRDNFEIDFDHAKSDWDQIVRK